jgi:carbonic anhydrase/acetyltransferase-like protein (isoleucine patch superfamily)
VFVAPSAHVAGDVEAGDDVSFWFHTVARGDVHHIRIGARTNIQDGSVLHVTHRGPDSVIPEGAALTVGGGVTVGHGAMLHACTIEDDCLIGIGAIVMDRAVVRRHALIAAGTVVGPGKDLEGGYIWLGNPARKGRALTAREIAFFEYSARHYVELKHRHAGSGGK